MIQNTCMKIMAFILAVVLFTTAAGVCQENPSTSEVEGENNMNIENDALRPVWAELPEQTHISRSRVNRFYHRKDLAEQRPRSAFKRAIERLKSNGQLREESKGSGVWILDKRSTLRRMSDFLSRRVQVIRHGFAVRRFAKQYIKAQKNAELASEAFSSVEIAPQSVVLYKCSCCVDVTHEVDLTVETAPQCIECFLDETDALTQTRESIDKYADCEPVDGLLSDLNPDLVEYGHATLRRTFRAVAVIAVSVYSSQLQPPPTPYLLYSVVVASLYNKQN